MAMIMMTTSCSGKAVATAAARGVRAQGGSVASMRPTRAAGPLGLNTQRRGARTVLLPKTLNSTCRGGTVAVRASGEGEGDGAEGKAAGADMDKELSKSARKIASTFAPRASTASKNPAFKGSALYTIFEARRAEKSSLKELTPAQNHKPITSNPDP